MKKDPYPAGTRVHLPKDKQARPWVVIGRLPWGTLLIQREGARPSRFAQMYVTENQIRKITP